MYPNPFPENTVLHKLYSSLESNGMLPSQAKAVVDAFMEGEKDSSMACRWNDDPRDYPDVFFTLQWLLIRHYALRYIDSLPTVPWYRPVFLSDTEQAAWMKENEIKLKSKED